MDYRFIYKDEFIHACGEIKNSRLINLYNLQNITLGNIYRARVEKYIKSMDSHILNLAPSFNAILKKSKREENISVGNDLLVQVIKEANGNKLAEVSQKLSEEDSINLIREKNLLPTPKLIQGNNFLKQFIKNYDKKIISNYKLEGVTFEENFNLQYDLLISNDIKKSKQREVQFSDGNIIFDKLEALTVIDINSKSKNEKLSKEKMSYKTNLNSLEEICIQISLRNIKKMVIIDFIRMNDEENEKLIKEFKQISRQYGLKIKFMGFSNMNFYEIIVF